MFCYWFKYLLLTVDREKEGLNRGLCVCERESERRSHHSGVYSASEIVLIAACLQIHMKSSLCLSRDSVPLSGLN